MQKKTGSYMYTYEASHGNLKHCLALRHTPEPKPFVFSVIFDLRRRSKIRGKSWFFWTGMCRGRGSRTDQVVLSPGTGPRRLALFGTTPTAPLAPTAGSPKPLENLMFPCIPLMCTSCTADIVSWVLFTVPGISCDASSASCCLPWTPAKESLVK